MANKSYNPLLIDSVKTSADLLEHRFVGFDGNYCTEGGKALGVVDVSTAKEQYAPVAIFGILLVESGETVTKGDAITSDAEGKAIKAASSAIVNGYALDDGVTGQEIRILKV